MSFADPYWLLGLLAVPVLLGLHILAGRRAKRYAVRFPAMASLRIAAAGGLSWRRHIPVGLLLLAVAALLMTLARPDRTVRIANAGASIMLVFDHSGSMEATDVAPNRLAAAEQAANTFMSKLPSAVKVGVVTFSSAPDGVQAPTTNRTPVKQLIGAQVADGATATGDALSLALTLLPHAAKGKPDPSAIVLLSDGAYNTGQNPLPVATQAGGLRIPIYTVGLGTAGATIPDPESFTGVDAVPPDPALMAAIAAASHAQSYSATDAGSLNGIYKKLGSQLGSRPRRDDITVSFAVAGLLLLGAAAAAAVGLGARMS
ncbi:MAG TPA: VWA domain-containing protein [Solirubrobacteraceae bacterium]|jgi:Ca-activated chloride channel family protein|nr:VWA domain-containing protein [Solirubrobacteraceae bacterium]